MKYRRDPIATAVRYALCATAAVGLSAPVLAQAQEDEAADLERVTVTGSRIKRTDIEGALPVTVITRDEIDNSGYTSAGEFIRQLPFNSFGSYRPQSGSSFGGAAEVNLRGLGASRTLVLVNGRRLPKAPQTGASNDLNIIPLGAVERIEILTDGASAIYGSDALGGVINVILRKDFQGAELMLGAADPSIPNEGGDRTEGSVVFGASSATSSIIAGASWDTRDIVFARDYPWVTQGASFYGNSFRHVAPGVSPFALTAIPGGCEPTTFANPAAAVPRSSGGLANSAGDTFRCGYDFALVSADEASFNNKSAFARAEHQISPDWTLYSDILYARSESFGRYAPVPDTSDPIFGGFGPISVDSPNNPTNPASPLFDPAFLTQIEGGAPVPVHWWHRFDALGTRDDTNGTEVTDLLVGAQGMIGNVEVDFGWRDTDNQYTRIGRNYLVRTTASQFIEDGTYDLQNPLLNDPQVLNSMKATIARISIYNQWEAYVSAAWDWLDTDAGAVQWFLGAEYREEVYSDQYDSLSEAGAIGGSAGNSAGGVRDVTSAYFETLIPVIADLEVSVAGRYDKYSDYGNDFSPKVSVRWQPLAELTVRGSYGEGFRAPSLDIVTQLDSFSADSVNDEATCLAAAEPADCSIQINGLRTANPDLQSEQSEQFSFGVAYQPLDWISGTLDYWNIEISERIAFFGTGTLLNREQAGDPAPPGLGVERDPATGAITRIVQGFGNEGTVEVDGIDLSLTTTFDLVGGRLSNNLTVAYTNSYKTDGGRDLVDDPGNPQWRATLQNVYEYGDFSFGWNMNAIADQCDEIDDGACVGHVPTWVTHDLQVNYFTPWNGRFTIGVLNAFEKFPPIDVGFTDGRDYDFNLYNGDGRIVYARYKQSF